MEDKNLVMEFKVNSFRKIPNPYLKSTNAAERESQMYVLICDVKNVPDNIPMDTNPRKQSLKTDVAKEVKKSLLFPSMGLRNFYLLNRGMLISAKSITYNNESSTVKVVFSDTSVHGDVDGGHTYEIIKQNRDELDYGEQYVKIEVLTGVEEYYEDLAKARNFSVKVHEKSLDDLSNKFQIIKDSLKNEPYINDIAYVENDIKRIDIMDILALFNMFNIDRYPNDRYDLMPISSYSSKNTCLKYYIDEVDKHVADPENNPYVKMSSIMPSIIRLFDKLEKNMHLYYKGDSAALKKYGSITGVSMSKGGSHLKTRYMNEDIDYKTTNGLLYPIIGAFKALVIEVDGVYQWKADPFKIMDKAGQTLVNNTIQQSRDLGNNPNATGKKALLWQNLFMMVQMLSNMPLD